jgi:hypothetical protein
MGPRRAGKVSVLLAALVASLPSAALAQRMTAKDPDECATCIRRPAAPPAPSPGQASGITSRMGATSSPPAAPRIEGRVHCERCFENGSPPTSWAIAEIQKSRQSIAHATMPEGPTETELYSYRVGRIQGRREVPFRDGSVGISEANGVIISPCYAITNAHVLYGTREKIEEYSDFLVDFYFGVSRDTEKFRWRVTGSPRRSGAMTLAGGGDWALVKLANCPGKRVGWPALDVRTPEELRGTPLRMFAILPTQNGGAVSLTTCRAVGVELWTGALTHTCFAKHGMSGAGLFTNDGKLAALLVGESKGIYVAVTMKEIFSDGMARALIDADKSTWLASLQ